MNSSSTVYPQRPSASHSSAISQIYSYDLMIWGGEEESTENPYKLSDLLGRPQSQLVDHREAYHAIMEWLVDVTQIPAESILIDHKIAGMEDCPLLWTSECKRPDVPLTSANKCVLVQREVDSGDMESTVRKLGVGLVDQLCWLRNHNRTSIMKCSGFYFMGGSGRGHVIHIELMWVDELLRFVLERQRLPMGSVATKVEEVLGEAQRSLASMAGRRMAGFALHISRNFIQSRFGAGAMQVPSVVIANPHTRKVYKHCLNMVDGNTLIELWHLSFDREPPTRIVFPESIMNIGKRFVFDFPLLKPPLSPEAAHQHAQRFVESVYEAISELHVHFNLAHLDVRLGNICISADSTGFVAKLIDLDRSAPADQPVKTSPIMSYTNSIMYKVKGRDWTLGQLDWRQFGIMVFAFLNEKH